MNTFETSAKVGEEGQVIVAGVPFAAGTEVEIAISLKQQPAEPVVEELTLPRARMQELFRTIEGFRNSPRIPREELYDRGSLR
jgi:hypothetical protein